MQYKGGVDKNSRFEMADKSFLTFAINSHLNQIKANVSISRCKLLNILLRTLESIVDFQQLMIILMVEVNDWFRWHQMLSHLPPICFRISKFAQIDLKNF